MAILRGTKTKPRQVLLTARPSLGNPLLNLGPPHIANFALLRMGRLRQNSNHYVKATRLPTDDGTSKSTKLAPNPIANNRITDSLGSNDSNPGCATNVGSQIGDYKEGSCDPFATTLYSAENLAVRDAVFTGKQRTTLLGRELGAALATTCGKDGASRTRAHPQPETVNFGPAAVIRLKSALAHEDMLLVTDPADAGEIGVPMGTLQDMPQFPSGQTYFPKVVIHRYPRNYT